MSQIKKNFIYNVLYQILILILPLVTVPYISRILGVRGVGIYSYTYSIVSYFILIAMLGINNYGNRTIAKVRDDKEKLSKTFISIYSIQLFMSTIMLVLYLIYALVFEHNYFSITLIQVIALIATFFDINWFFFGLEKFKITVTRSTLLKILSLILIFMFVKTKNDLWIYTLIMTISTLVSQLILLPFLLKEIKFIKVTKKDVIPHIKPCLILFIPVVAVSLYKVMDKIMLGLLANVNEVGYYEQAEKIVSLPIGIVTALGTVMLPRISNLVSKGDNSKVLEYIEKSIKFMMFLAFPICLGLIGISSDFVPIFLGNAFNKSSVLIYYLSITIIFISFANIIRTAYLIPKEKDKVFITSVVLGAIVNLIINILLIPRFLSIGACIGTIFAELFVMMYQVLCVRKELNIKKYIIDIIPFFIKSMIMFGIIMSIKLLDISSLKTILLQLVVGVITYIVLNIKYIKSIINISLKGKLVK